MANFSITTDDKAEWALHKADCKDLAKASGKMLEIRDTYTAEDAEEAVTIWIDDELIEMGYDNDAVRIMPCAKSDKPQSREAKKAGMESYYDVSKVLVRHEDDGQDFIDWITEAEKA